jgi:hypothetical protein
MKGPVGKGEGISIGLLVIGVLVGVLSLTYKKGQHDKINEFCQAVETTGETTVTYPVEDRKDIKIHMTKI